MYRLLVQNVQVAVMSVLRPSHCCGASCREQRRRRAVQRAVVSVVVGHVVKIMEAT